MNIVGRNNYAIMVDHLTRSQIEKFHAKALVSSEMVEVAEHLEVCSSCHSLFQEIFWERRNYRPFSFSFSAEDWFKDDHLEFEDIVALIENKLDDEYVEILNIHLSTCPRCHEAVQDLKEFRQQIETQLSVRYLPEEQTVQTKSAPGWWKWPLPSWQFSYATAAVLITGLVILAAIIFGKYWAHKQPFNEIITDRTNTISPLPQVSASISPSPPGTSEIAVQPKEIVIHGEAAGELLALNDAGKRIVLDKSGNISGLENLTPPLQQAVKGVLLAKDIEKPKVLAEVDIVSGKLRGNADKDSPFKLVSPLITVVAEDRPTFRWEALKGATGYQVHIVNLGSREVVSSEQLSSEKSKWTTKTPLKRAALYSWVVTGYIDGREVSSPAPAAPEAKFVVLSKEKWRELNQLKRDARSHLALGVFYAQAGMIAEAEREFQMLLKENPQSPIAAKLLQRVRSWR